MILTSEFAKRRQKVARSMAENSVLIVASAKIAYRNRDVEYPFRQNSDFYYLTGFEEPHALLLLIPGHDKGEFVLFNQVRDLDMETWNGPRAGQQGAVETFGADVAYPIDELDETIVELLRDRTRIYYSFSDHSDLPADVWSWCKTLSSNPREDSTTHELIDIDPILHEMRLFKSESELENLRRAADVTVKAHERAMRFVKPGQYEYQLEAELLHAFVSQGCRQQAYGAIVGGGKNACVLHYILNEDELKEGDLVLVDAGAEYKNYASDVTRTYPVCGKFNEEQAQIYNIVLEAQLAVIDMIKPGVVWNKAQEIATEIITAGLKRLGFVFDDVKQFYMHGVSHWMGLDVHDVGSYKVGGQWREIEPGMVFTVEPGIYITQNENIDKKWWNMGVRIEDDVVVTATGCEVLTDALPKKIADIEQLMAAR